ncbi:MAG: hypothetical protein Q7S29_03965 [Candidatus Peribacter sp.]|nr:hypothetical protein [Candidatus Peribacter sp.]
MSDLETVSVRKKPDVGMDIALLGERSVVEQTGCMVDRRGDSWMFSMEHGGEPMLIRQEIRRSVEDTGCFDILEPSVRSGRRVPAEGTGEG